MPVLNEAGVRRVCEEGAAAGAEDGLVEEEDLGHLEGAPGDPDALGRRAILAGGRDWEGPFGLEEIFKQCEKAGVSDPARLLGVIRSGRMPDERTFAAAVAAAQGSRAR